MVDLDAPFFSYHPRRRFRVRPAFPREYEGRHLAADQAMIVIAVPWRDNGRLRVMRKFYVGPKGADIDALRRYMSKLVPPIPPSSFN
jgi:hypothetical protein